MSRLNFELFWVLINGMIGVSEKGDELDQNRNDVKAELLQVFLATKDHPIHPAK